MKTNKKLLPMKLQFFAEDKATKEDVKDSGEGKNEDDKVEKTLEEILASDENLKKQYEEKLLAAVEEAKVKAVEDTKAQVQAEATEAQKLQAMNADERSAYETDKRLKALEEREAALIKRELKIEAVAKLKEEGIPEGLADILSYNSAEECHASISIIKDAFNKAVQLAVDEKIKGAAPLKKAPTQSGETVDEKAIEKAIAGRR